MRSKENSIREFKKLARPPDVSEGSLYSLGSILKSGAKSAGRKTEEMGRFFTSEWLREPGTQAFIMASTLPLVKKGIDKTSTIIRPKTNYKTNRKEKI